MCAFEASLSVQAASILSRGPQSEDSVTNKPGITKIDGRVLNESRGIHLGESGTFDFANYSIESSKSISTEQARQFQRENQDLLFVIDQSKEAQTELKTKKIKSRRDLESVIVTAAEKLLKDEAKVIIKKEDLKDNSLLASMIVLNTGGIRDKVNNDSDIAKTLFNKGSSNKDKIFEKLAEKTTKLFNDKSNPLADVEFLKERPKVALFLQKRPDLVKEFNFVTNGKTLSQTFKDRVEKDEFQDIFDNFVSEFAANATDSGAFNSTFFSNNIEVAEFVGASEFFKDTPTAAQFIEKNPRMALGNITLNEDRFNVDSFIRDVSSFQALSKLDPRTPMTFSFLQNNQGFSQLLSNNSEFRLDFETEEAKSDLKILLGVDKRAKISEDTLSVSRERFETNLQNLRNAVLIML